MIIKYYRGGGVTLAIDILLKYVFNFGMQDSVKHIEAGLSCGD